MNVRDVHRPYERGSDYHRRGCDDHVSEGDCHRACVQNVCGYNVCGYHVSGYHVSGHHVSDPWCVNGVRRRKGKWRRS